MATQPVHVIASSLQTSALPQRHPGHSTSMLGEIYVCVLPFGDPRYLSRSTR
jgi:hypothetical protein